MNPIQVRQVEYKDKMDEEWELFTRAMKEQSVVRNIDQFVTRLIYTQEVA